MSWNRKSVHRLGMLATFPQCNFILEYPAIHFQTLSLTKSCLGIPKFCNVGDSLTCPIEPPEHNNRQTHLWFLVTHCNSPWLRWLEKAKRIGGWWKLWNSRGKKQPRYARCWPQWKGIADKSWYSLFSSLYTLFPFKYKILLWYSVYA